MAVNAHIYVYVCVYIHTHTHTHTHTYTYIPGYFFGLGHSDIHVEYATK